MSRLSDEKRILEAAAQEFSERGYEGVSMRDLAEHCGVSTQVLYSQFISKEELYHEACGHALDAFFEGVGQRLAQAGPAQRGPELLAEAFFDTWLQNRTPLLLTNRDVINALVQPERWLTARHYPRVLKLIRELVISHFRQAVDDAFAFSFAAVTFGYCSLMIIDQRYAAMLDPAKESAERQAYLRGRKATMVKMCSLLWEGMLPSARPVSV